MPICIGAALAGIRSVKLPGRLPRPDHFPEPASRKEGALAAFCANHGQMLDDPEEAFGYTVTGPLVLAFARWLRSRRAARPQGRLLFLARDMYLVREVCRLLGEQESGYLGVSRRSLCPALLMRPMTPEAQALLLDTLPRQVMRVEDILDFLRTRPRNSNCPAMTAAGCLICVLPSRRCRADPAAAENRRPQPGHRGNARPGECRQCASLSP